MKRRVLLAGGGAALGLAALGGCAGLQDGSRRWQARLRGDTVALLGEVHDNPGLHRQRSAALQEALERGWRPTLVMEQFDVERQADLERSRRERPRDVGHLVEQAAGSRSGWSWPDYEPVIAMALARDLPLRAGNLGRAAAARIVREGYGAVFSTAEIEALGLGRAIDADLQRAQERAIDAGHCGALPPPLLPTMARAQFARDAVMARAVRDAAAGGGVVLLAGNGHVRRDLGVPRWLAPIETGRVLAVGFVEDGHTRDAGRFDAVMAGAPAARPDPCAGFVRPA